MKVITYNQVKDGVKNAFLKANTDVTAVKNYLDALQPKEKNPMARDIMATLSQNYQLAKELSIPSCQDTGMAVVFCEVGTGVSLDFDLTVAINEGVREAYKDGCFRKSVVDPITRENTKDNTPAIIHYDIKDGDSLEITVLPKGFGSENMSEIAMLTPAQGIDGVYDFIVDVVRRKGANACPPLVVGVGIGGSFEKCALMAKHALTRELGSQNANSDLALLEDRLLEDINGLDIGPMGLGGTTTALDVFIEKHPTHIAGLPVAVNIMCHALRHERVVL